MKDPLADWYRHHFDTLSSDPPPDGWQQIQQRLHNSQRIEKRRQWPAILALFTLLFFPLILGVNRNTHPIKAKLNLTEKPWVQTSVIQSAQISFVSEAKVTATENVAHSRYEQHCMDIITVKEPPQESELAMVKPIPAKLPFHVLLPEIMQQGIVWPSTEIQNNPKSKWARSFSLGTFCFGTASVLLNREFCYALRKETNNGVAANYGLSYGILAGYRLNTRNGIEAELLLNEAGGQIYNRYTGGKYVRHQLGLNYRGLALLMNSTLYQASLRNKIPLAFSMSFGMSAMKLKKNEVQFNDMAESSSVLPYNTFNLSGITAATVETRLKGDLILGLQVRLSGGLTNIFKGTSEIPAWFNRTHTVNISTGIRLRKNF